MTDIEEDGVYVEVFVIQDGKRYNTKIMKFEEMFSILSNGLMDSVTKVMKG